jgi:hypothetical protein
MAAPSGLSREHSLLLGILRGDDPATLRAGMASPFNWDRFCSVALSNGVAPLVYVQLKSAGLLSAIPPVVESKCGLALYKAALRNAAVREQLIALTGPLRQEPIAVFVKGAVLAWTVYADPGLRRMTDIDLISLGSYRERVRRLLAQNHFVLQDTHWKGFGISVDDYHHVEAGVRLDVGFFPDRPLASVWARRIVVENADLQLPTLSWEDHLVYICVHALGHLLTSGGICLLWLYDLDQLLRWNGSRPEWEWSRVEASADEFGVRNVLYFMLSLARTLLGTRHGMDPRPISRLRQRVLTKTFADARLCLAGGPGWTIPSSSRTLLNLACLVDHRRVVYRLAMRLFNLRGR